MSNYSVDGCQANVTTTTGVLDWIVGSLSNNDGDQNGKNPIGLDSPNNIFARASRFFEQYLAVVARLQRESA